LQILCQIHHHPQIRSTTVKEQGANK